MKRLIVAVLMVVSAVACGSSTTGEPEIMFRSEPDPPVTGDNTFEVMLMQGGQPVSS